MIIEKLEQKGALETLIVLYKKGEASINEIDRNTEVNLTTLREKTLVILRESKLVKYYKSKKFPFSHVYSLTEKGLKLAKCLYEIINE